MELVSDTRLEEASRLGIWSMGSSVGCLGGRSKSRQGQNGQAAASTSPRSGTFHSDPFCEHMKSDSSEETITTNIFIC